MWVWTGSGSVAITNFSPEVLSSNSAGNCPEGAFAGGVTGIREDQILQLKEPLQLLLKALARGTLFVRIGFGGGRGVLFDHTFICCLPAWRPA